LAQSSASKASQQLPFLTSRTFLSSVSTNCIGFFEQGLMSFCSSFDTTSLPHTRCSATVSARPVTYAADSRLVTTLSLVSHALELRELIDSTESGRFWIDTMIL